MGYANVIRLIFTGWTGCRIC